MNEPVRREVRVRCSLEHAFDVFTTRLDLWWPKGHRRFDRSRLILEPEQGGRFFERADSGEEAVLGEVLRCQPPHGITYTWYPGAGVGPTQVEVSFRDEGEHTLVEVVHSEGDSALAEAWPARATLFVRAWSHVLPAFAAFAERTPQPPAPA
ncbi:SRPBCC domain-containing protein [Haliangium sp.]|uniref:SRPBCC domain-containing protein n=1 Tax=Haliangium sp. TaxID=2663208 RepID=UPI003D0CC9F7